jgi:uncharacterized protein
VLPPVALAKAILLLAAYQPAQEIQQLFPAHPTGYVTDVPGALDAPSVGSITELAERLRGATGAELAIVVLPTIGDRAAVDVAVAIGRTWGVGAKAELGDPRRNAGLVILLVPKREGDPNSGQIFIATGQGLEGIVTDLQAGKVRDLMTPFFRRSEYGKGLDAGVRALAGLIARGRGVTDSALTAGGRDLERPSSGLAIPGFFMLLFWLLMAVFIFARFARVARLGRRGRRGPFWWGGSGFGGGFGGGGFGGFGGGGGGGGFGGFGGGGGFSGGGAGGRF